IVSRGQHIADDLAIVCLVFDHQNALAHAASTCRSTITGNVKVNVEPLPGCDSTQIRPPCISMMRLDMASPKPVPPFFLVMALSACWNSLTDWLDPQRKCQDRCHGPIRRTSHYWRP